MATLSEGRHRGEYLVSEANGHRSRETITLTMGQNLSAGTVLGVVGGKHVQLDPQAVTGAEVAVAVLYDNVDATAADTPAVITARDAEVNGGELVWPAGITELEKATAVGQLADANIIVR